jgi:hypothetical protein
VPFGNNTVAVGALSSSLSPASTNRAKDASTAAGKGMEKEAAGTGLNR